VFDHRATVFAFYNLSNVLHNCGTVNNTPATQIK